VLRVKTTEEWSRMPTQADIPVAPVHSFDTLLHDGSAPRADAKQQPK